MLIIIVNPFQLPVNASIRNKFLASKRWGDRYFFYRTATRMEKGRSHS
ncbi:hypothetical protein [Microcoleus sp. S28C3]